MRIWASVLLIGIVVSSAANVSAAPTKKGHDGFDDLFSAVDSASAHHAKRSHASRHHSKARHAERQAAQRPKRETQVAEAEAPRAQQAGEQLVLSEYAPNRHAWVGP